jgi:hypothetical protein
MYYLSVAFGVQACCALGDGPAAQGIVGSEAMKSTLTPPSPPGDFDDILIEGYLLEHIFRPVGVGLPVDDLSNRSRIMR